MSATEAPGGEPAVRGPARLADDGLGGPQLRFGRTVALSVDIQGPVAGVIVGPAVLAGIVGGSEPSPTSSAWWRWPSSPSPS